MLVLPRAGGTRYQNGTAAEKSFAAQHGIERVNTAGDALRGNLSIKQQGSYRQNRNAIFVDEEGIFIGAMC